MFAEIIFRFQKFHQFKLCVYILKMFKGSKQVSAARQGHVSFRRSLFIFNSQGYISELTISIFPSYWLPFYRSIYWGRKLLNHTLTCSVTEPLVYTANSSKSKLIGQTTINAKCGLIFQVHFQLLATPTYTIISLIYALNKPFFLKKASSRHWEHNKRKPTFGLEQLRIQWINCILVALSHRIQTQTDISNHAIEAQLCCKTP